MPTDFENVRSSGQTESERRMVNSRTFRIAPLFQIN